MDGVLVINKPKGYTSHDIVNIVRRELNIKKVGHTGTLDPNATGVLPILIGKATKISKYLVEHNKTYITALKLGEKTDTGDSEGQVIEKQSNLQIPELSTVQDVLSKFIGKQKQIPPQYSAIKINGKKAYQYARKGQPIELEPRDIEILEIRLIEFKNNEVKFQVTCSKGTYIRTLCEDIAEKLGTIGYMSTLERTSVDKFEIKDALELEELKEKAKDKIISIEKIFEEMPKIIFKEKEEIPFLNGVKMQYFLPDGTYGVYANNDFIGLGIISSNILKRDVCIK